MNSNQQHHRFGCSLDFVGRRLIVMGVAVCALLTLTSIGAAHAQSAENSTSAQDSVRLVAQLGHASDVTTVAVSPDGALLATGSADQTVCLWDVATGRQLPQFDAPFGAIMTVAFSPDGRHLLIASSLGVEVREVATGDTVRRIAVDAEKGGVRAAAVSPDGAFVVTGGIDGIARVWSVVTGDEVLRLDDHPVLEDGDRMPMVESVAFSPDGERVLTVGFDRTFVWDRATGREIRRIEGEWPLTSARFSPDGRFILTTGQSFRPFVEAEDGTWTESDEEEGGVQLWDAASGAFLRRFEGRGSMAAIGRFSPDGRRILTSDSDGSARVWDAATGAELRRFDIQMWSEGPAAFAASGERAVVTGIDGVVRLYSVDDGATLQAFGGECRGLDTLAFTPDGAGLVTGDRGGVAHLWSFGDGVERRSFSGDAQPITALDVSPDGSRLVTAGHHPSQSVEWAGENENVRSWDLRTGELNWGAFHDSVYGLAYAPGGGTLVFGCEHGHVRVVDAVDGSARVVHEGGTYRVFAVDRRGDGATLGGGQDGRLRLWRSDAVEGPEFFEGPGAGIYGVCFDPSGALALAATQGAGVRVFDTETLAELASIGSAADTYRCVAVSPNGRIVAAGSCWGDTQLFELESRTSLGYLVGNGEVTDVAFSPDGLLLATTSRDGTTRLWDLTTGELACRLMSFVDGTWAVVDPQGRFDASNGGDVSGLHFVSGLEPIALAQLKDRFYEPGLLAKVLAGDPLRDVSKLKNLRLFPEVESVAVDAGGELRIELRERAGGIGAVEVFVDGKRVSADARPNAGLETRGGRAVLDVDIETLAGGRLTPGVESRVEIVVRSEADAWLSSRGFEVVYTPKGVAPETAAPRLLALCVGTSDYTGDAIDLRFAAKDAADFARALDVAASGLFNTDLVDRVEVTLLSTAPGEEAPTRARILSELQRIASTAGPQDVVVVYLAGHGVTLETATGDASEVFHYLTADASTASVGRLSSDEALRAATTISSEDLAQILNSTASRRRVVVLDTCAAGAALEDLGGARALPSDQIRALERLEDRTGMWVLGGCAADAVSYEASRFAQGLLTRSLLLGMRGGALRDGRFVDVSSLFEFAADTTSDLAAGVGGIQRPQIFRPTAGSASFDIGMLADEAARRAVPLETARPIFVRSSFQDEDDIDDVLGLGERLDRALREASTRGSATDFVQVDARSMPGAIRVSGRYERTTDGLRVTLSLTLDERRSRVVVELPSDPDAAVALLVERVAELAREL